MQQQPIEAVNSNTLIHPTTIVGTKVILTTIELNIHKITPVNTTIEATTITTVNSDIIQEIVRITFSPDLIKTIPTITDIKTITQIKAILIKVANIEIRILIKMPTKGKQTIEDLIQVITKEETITITIKATITIETMIILIILIIPSPTLLTITTSQITIIIKEDQMIIDPFRIKKPKIKPSITNLSFLITVTISRIEININREMISIRIGTIINREMTIKAITIDLSIIEITITPIGMKGNHQTDPTIGRIEMIIAREDREVIISLKLLKISSETS